MTVLLWGALGYAASLVPTRRTGRWMSARLAPRIGADRADRWAPPILFAIIVASVVAFAAWLAGPYEAAACSLGAVAGHCWSVSGPRRPWSGLPAATGAFAVLLPFELFVAMCVLAAARAARTGRAAFTLALLAVPLAAALRGQPAPFRFAAWATLVLIAIRRLEGISGEVAGGASPGGAVARRLILGGPGPQR